MTTIVKMPLLYDSLFKNKIKQHIINIAHINSEVTKLQYFVKVNIFQVALWYFK
jgi:hypothetical protein